MGTSLINLICESVAVSGDPQAPASSLTKPELRPLSSQSGDWEPAQWYNVNWMLELHF